MYLQTFGLKRHPFSMTSDPAVLFLSAGHREALAGLCYGLLDRKGLLVMLGHAGTGKTTLLAKAMQTVPSGSMEFAAVQNPTLTPAEFLEAVLLAFEIREVPASKPQRLALLQGRLLDLYTDGTIATLLLDEAHKLSPEALEEVRLLGNLEHRGEKLLQIVLAGQEELRAVLNRAEMAQLKQRVAVRLSLEPLSPPEVAQYVRHRWASAGGIDNLPFPPAALEHVARFSQGIPRLVNVICDTALLMACGERSTRVEARHVIDSCVDLDLVCPTAKRVLPAAAAPSLELASPKAVAQESPMPTLMGYQARAENRSRWALWSIRPRREKEPEQHGQSSERIASSAGRTPGTSAALAE
jgi:general secretion pathway protein A